MNRKLLLLSVLVVLLYGCLSCQDPIDNRIKFNNERISRESRIVERLIDIRNAEVFYKQAKGCYTDNFDTLICFCKNNEIPVVRLKPDLVDTTYVVIYDTAGYISVVDSIAGKRTEFDIEAIRFVPYGESNTQFELNAGFIDRRGISVPVFEAKTPYESYMKNPPSFYSSKEWNNQLKELMNSGSRYNGLKVGSMEEASIDGNWETLNR